ncbi:MAG TPA: AMP-binding protein [Streptosporangiaceae bacterium]
MPARALLCDRHRDEAVAFTVVEPDLSDRDLTFGELGELSARFAAGLAGLGVGRGDAVATLMGKSAELVVALLGIWRRGAVHVPLFTAFAPAAIAFRLARSGAAVVVAGEDQRAKLEPGSDMPADPPWRIVSGGRSRPGDVPLAEMMATGAARSSRPLSCSATPARAPRNSPGNSSSSSRTNSPRTPTRAGYISLTRCPKPPAARSSDTSSAGNVPDRLRRDTARRASS